MTWSEIVTPRGDIRYDNIDRLVTVMLTTGAAG